LKTQTFAEKPCFHHRKMGSAQRGALKIAFHGGMTDYRLGSFWMWQIFRTPYQMTKTPVIAGGMLRLLGFYWAMVIRKSKVISSDVEAFRRGEQIARMGAWFSGAQHPNMAGVKRESQG